MSIEQNLQTEKIAHIDLSNYVVVRPEAAVAQVLDFMRRDGVSAALVEDEEGKLCGIFTERDVLLKVADNPSSWKEPVSVFMSPDPQVLAPGELVGRALDLMNAGHYRNMPVLDAEGRIAGNLSQHAVIRWLTDRFPREVYNLPPDPEKIPTTREGA